MKIFRSGSKTNFVDSHDVIVGYDWAETDCCEDPGWFISADENKKIVPGILNSRAHDVDSTLEGYVFDKDYFRMFHVDKGGIELYMAIFRLHVPMCKGKCDLYLHLYNEQNGFYCHGFTQTDRGELELRKML